VNIIQSARDHNHVFKPNTVTDVKARRAVTEAERARRPIQSVTSESNVLQGLPPFPTDFVSWKKKILDEDGFGWQWEALRPFFLQRGYDLYVSKGCNGLKPRVDIDPATDSFSLHGVRANFSWKPLLASFVSMQRFGALAIQPIVMSSLNLLAAEVRQLPSSKY